MKKIAFELTRCKGCSFNFISDMEAAECPNCGGRLTKDSSYKIQGFDTDEVAFIGFTKKVKRIRKNANSNKPRELKKNK